MIIMLWTAVILIPLKVAPLISVSMTQKRTKGIFDLEKMLLEKKSWVLWKLEISEGEGKGKWGQKTSVLPASKMGTCFHELQTFKASYTCSKNESASIYGGFGSIFSKRIFAKLV